MRKRLKFSIGAVLIVLAVTYLVAGGMDETTTAYYLTVSEAARFESDHQDRAVKVKGKVGEGSIDWSPKELRLMFTLVDDQQQMPVSYRGIVPDLFAEGREVIVEGRLTSAGLAAKTILASCPSKYESKDNAANHFPP